MVRLRRMLSDLDTLPLAALLRELGAVLYNRDIIQWRALTDISGELLDRATVAARTRIAARVTGDSGAASAGVSNHGQAAITQSVGPSQVRGPTGSVVRDAQPPNRHAASVTERNGHDTSAPPGSGHDGRSPRSAAPRVFEPPPRAALATAGHHGSADSGGAARVTPRSSDPAVPRVGPPGASRSHDRAREATSDKRDYVK